MKTSPYNPFDYLETPEEINEYLETAMQDDDPRVFLIALGYLARKSGMIELAGKTGLNRENLYRSLSGEGNPHFSTVTKVTKALGVRLIPEKMA